MLQLEIHYAGQQQYPMAALAREDPAEDCSDIASDDGVRSEDEEDDPHFWGEFMALSEVRQVRARLI